MSLVVQSGNRLLQLTRRVESSPDRWLVDLRWIATAGMFATIVGGKAVAPGLRAGPLYATLAGLVAVNCGWLLVLTRRPSLETRRTLSAQIVLDLAFLGVLLWHSGGLENPFAPFLTFQVVLAGLLTPPRTTVLITGLTLLVATVLHGAPPLPLSGSAADAERVRVVGRLLAIVAMGLFLGCFVWLYARRVEWLNEERGRNEKLAALGRTLAAMCHELNTPLGTIVIASKDLEALGRDLGHREIVDLALTVSQSATRASDLISLLRGAVRPNAVREPVELSSFVREVAEKELDRLGFAGARTIFAPVPVCVPVLPTALSQILVNLLKNAVDAVGTEPAPRIEVAVVPRAGGVDVHVTDNGRGVSPRILARLGEPFQTTKAEGLGLGLYVSSLLAEGMGGRLAIGDSDGEGARLTLSFELADTTGSTARPDLITK